MHILLLNRKHHLTMKPLPSHLLQPPPDSSPPKPLHLGHISVFPNLDTVLSFIGTVDEVRLRFNFEEGGACIGFL